MDNQSGFTLLEIVVSMILFSILASLAGMWLVMGAQGYRMTRENVVVSQKARLAMNRLSRELTEMSDLDVAGSTGSCIVYRVDPLSTFYRVVTLEGTGLVLKANASGDCSCTTCDGANTYMMSDQVSGFQVTYESQDGSVSTTPPVFAELAAVHVSFDMTRTDGESLTHTFGFSVNPRNTLDVSAP